MTLGISEARKGRRTTGNRRTQCIPSVLVIRLGVQFLSSQIDLIMGCREHKSRKCRIIIMVPSTQILILAGVTTPRGRAADLAVRDFH